MRKQLLSLLPQNWNLPQWTGEQDMHKELMEFKKLAKVWLETKGMPDDRQYMFTK